MQKKSKSNAKKHVPPFVRIAIGNAGRDNIPIVYGLGKDGRVWRLVDNHRRADNTWKRLPTEVEKVNR